MRILDTTTLGRTATVVRKRSNIDDLRNLNARGIDGTDSTLTAITRTLNECLHLAKTEVESHLGAILCCHLGSVRSVLLGTAESHLTSRRPGNNLTLIVGQRYNNVVERTVNVELTHRGNTHVSLLRCC